MSPNQLPRALVVDWALRVTVMAFEFLVYLRVECPDKGVEWAS